MKKYSKYGFVTPTLDKFNKVSENLMNLGLVWEVGIESGKEEVVFNIAKSQTCILISNTNELSYASVSEIPEYVELFELTDFLLEYGFLIRKQIAEERDKARATEVQFDVLNRHQVVLRNQNFAKLTDAQKERVAYNLDGAIKEILIEEYKRTGHLNYSAMSFFESPEFWTELKRLYDGVLPTSRHKFLRDIDRHVLTVIDTLSSGRITILYYEKARECLDLLTVPRFKGDIISAKDLFGDRVEL